jgi:hypothetical protein
MDKSLAPGYVKITYTGSIFPHHMTLPINFDGVPTPGVEPSVILKDTTSLNVEAAILAYITLAKAFFPSTTHFGLAEVHAVDADTGEDTFIYGWNLNVVGTGAGAGVQFGQAVLSFKLVSGGVFKAYFMEGTSEENVKQFPPFSGAVDALADFVTSGDSPIYGRDNSYPFSPIAFTTKTNDALRQAGGI